MLKSGSKFRIPFRYVVAGLGVAAGLVALVAAADRLDTFLANDPRFILPDASYSEAGATTHLQVAGVAHASMPRIQRVFEEDGGRSVYLLPIGERREALEKIDWVKEASVARVWPNYVRVAVQERKPVAFAQLPPTRDFPAHRMTLIDAEGVILAPPSRAHFTLPVLLGIQVGDSQAVRRRRVHRMQEILKELGPLGQKISELDLGNMDRPAATLEAGGRGVVVLLGDRNWRNRLQNFLDRYDEIRQRAPAAVLFDLRLDGRITVVEGRNGK
jgi:cell division protein FtsQ